MPKVIISKDFCKGCGLCFDVCPKKLLEYGSEITALGTYIAIQKDEEKCTGCKLCAIICPDSAINVYK